MSRIKGVAKLRTLFPALLSILLVFPTHGRCQEKKAGAMEVTVKVVTVITRDNLNHRLSLPTSLFYDMGENELYVTTGGKVLVFTPDYFPYLSLGKGREIYAPTGVFVDRAGNLFVCQGKSNEDPRAHISVLNAAFLPAEEIYFKGFPGAENFIPNRIAIGANGRMYVAGLNYRGLVVLDEKGHFVKLLAPKDYIVSPDMTRVATINDVTIDARGRIYLLSEEMGRVYVYDKKERFLFKFGEKGGSTGKLSRPRGIAVDAKRGRIYVIDYMRHTGNIYSMDGKFLGEFGGRGWSPGWFNYPSDVAVDDQGNVIIADTFNQRVQVLKVTLKPAPTKPKGPAKEEGPTYGPGFPALQKKEGS